MEISLYRGSLKQGPDCNSITELRPRGATATPSPDLIAQRAMSDVRALTALRLCMVARIIVAEIHALARSCVARSSK